MYRRRWMWLYQQSQIATDTVVKLFSKKLSRGHNDEDGARGEEVGEEAFAGADCG